MKKTMLLAMVLAGFCICASGAQAVQMEFWGIQHRVYEDGTVLNRASFGMKGESGTYLTEDVVASTELYDPDGNKIEPAERTFFVTPCTINATYDADTGQWSYDTRAFLAGDNEIYYRLVFSAPVKAGTYRLKVTDKDGNTYEGTSDYAGQVELPTVSAKSFYARLDKDGNFIMTWEAPTWVDSTLETSARVWIANNEKPEQGYVPPALNADYNSLGGEVFAKIPMHMGFFFVPKEILDLLTRDMGEENYFIVGVHLRENSSSRTRYYTHMLTLDADFSAGSPCPVLSATDLSLFIPKVEFAGSFYELNLTCTDPATLTWKYESSSSY